MEFARDDILITEAALGSYLDTLHELRKNTNSQTDATTYTMEIERAFNLKMRVIEHMCAWESWKQ